MVRGSVARWLPICGPIIRIAITMITIRIRIVMIRIITIIRVITIRRTNGATACQIPSIQAS